jgi:3-oxoacyl-[acyl-carrier protein] reductase
MAPESLLPDMFDPGRPLRGKVALVTGASGGGVGSTTARLLAARGAAVIVNYLHNRRGAEQVVADIAAGGGQARAVRADVGEREQVERLVATALEAYGDLDILVSNANPRPSLGPGGAGAPGALGAAAWAFPRAFPDWSWEGFSRGVNARLQPAFLLTQAVLPAMRRRVGGRLIYVGSEHAEGPAGVPGMIANGTSAAALVTFVRYLAYELGPYGITVNVVAPGRIDTPGTARALAALGAPSGFSERLVAATPLGRTATPDDVARMIAFYAGEDSAFVTGTTGHVNGGFGIARLAGPRADGAAGAPPGGSPPVPTPGARR